MKKTILIGFILAYAFGFVCLRNNIQGLLLVTLAGPTSTVVEEATATAASRGQARGACACRDDTANGPPVSSQPSRLPEAPYGDLCETRTLTRHDLQRKSDGDGEEHNGGNSNNRNKKVIAYSLTHPDGGDPGDIPMWIWSGMVLNVKLAQRYYPEWRVRVYMINVNATLVRDTLAISDTVEVVRCGSSGLLGGGGVYQRVMARFLTVDDPSVRYTLVRDLDSRFSIREVMAVNEWLASGAPFHVMNDHNKHGTAVMAGMFGMKRGLFAAENYGHSNSNKRSTTMTAIVRDWLEHRSLREGVRDRVFDQEFLRRMVWPRVYKQAMGHDMILDRCERHRTAVCRPFPVGPRDNRAHHFVGAPFKTAYNFSMDSDAVYSCRANCTATRETLDFIPPLPSSQRKKRRRRGMARTHSLSSLALAVDDRRDDEGHPVGNCSCSGNRSEYVRKGAERTVSFGEGNYVCETQPHNEQQSWNFGRKNVISYMLSSDLVDQHDRDVWIGLDLNLKLAQRYFPEWIVRVYTVQVSPPVIEKILALSPKNFQVEVVRCHYGDNQDEDGRDDEAFSSMIRFLAVDDPAVDHVMIRDFKTSRFSPKELMAVNEWIASSSKRSLHIMQDGGRANQRQHGEEAKGNLSQPSDIPVLDHLSVDLKREGLFSNGEITMAEIIQRVVSKYSQRQRISSSRPQSSRWWSGFAKAPWSWGEAEIAGGMEEGGGDSTGEPIKSMFETVWDEARRGTVLLHDSDPKRCQREAFYSRPGSPPPSLGNEETILCRPFPLQGRVVMAALPSSPSPPSLSNRGIREENLVVGGLPPSIVVLAGSNTTSGAVVSSASDAKAWTAITTAEWQQRGQPSPPVPPKRRTTMASEYYYDCHVPCRIKVESLTII